MSKETILKEFDEKYPNTTLYQVQQFHIGTGHTERRNILISGDIKDFLSKAIDQTKKETREETIREIEELLLKNLRYDEYVLYGETGYITEIKIKDILNKLKK